MINKYKELKERHQKEYNDFPKFCAITKEDFITGMKKLGFEESDKDKVCYLGEGSFTFIKKDDTQKLKELWDRQHNELWQEINNDKNGTGFILDMFSYELANQEYPYTKDTEDTLSALGITEKQMYENKNLINGLELACKKIIARDQEEDMGMEEL